MFGQVYDADEDGEALRILDGRYLQTGDEKDLKFLKPDERLQERYCLMTGDILLPCVFRRTANIHVFAGGTKSIAGGSIIVIRIRSGDVSPQYIAEFLNSSLGKRLLSAVASDMGPQGSRLWQITPNALRTFAVPVVPLNLDELGKVDRLRDQMAEAVEELEARRYGIFDGQNANELKKNLDELRSKAELLTEAIRLASSLSFQISNLFPYPLAYMFRFLEGIVDIRLQYQEQLRFAENLLAFLGSISIAMLTNDDRAAIAHDLREQWSGGISPGGWKDLTNKCCRYLSHYTGNPVAERICGLKVASEKKGAFGEQLKFLIERKNDFKHDRGPKAEGDVKSQSGDMQTCLHECMKALTFLMRHPIRQVRDNDSIRRQPGRIRLSCLRIVGDHPGFRQEQIDWHQSLTKGDLYLEIDEGHWIPLYPFVRVLTCPRCKVDEIYFIDKWNGEAATMKSFERGHTESCKETGRELQEMLGKPE
jgi:hypothetical protein